MSGSESPGGDSAPPSPIPSPPLPPDGAVKARAPDDRYRALFNSIDQGFCIIKVLFDAGGKACDYRFVEVNPSFERHTGLKARTAAGRTARELVPRLEEHWFEIYGRVALTGAPERFEMPAQNMGGRHFDVCAFCAGEPEEHRVAVLFSDITARRGMERRLAEKARLLDLSNDAIMVRDAADRITLWNSGAEKMYGWRADEVLGMDLHTLMETEFPKPMEEIVAQLHREGEFTGEVVQSARDGRRIPTLCRWVLDHETGSILTSYTDISERRLLEAALRARAEDLAQADRSKNEFLAMLAHELRNPLAPMRHAAEILHISKGGDQEREEAHAMLLRQIAPMSRMIEDLLDVSRITEGKIELRREPVTLQSVLNAAAAALRPSMEARGQSLKVSFAPGERAVLLADAARLEQVFMNLLGNSCKYSPEGSCISLSAQCSSGPGAPQAVVRVRDEGKGIDPEVLPHVFDLFVQESRSSDRTHGGLGIGLTLVRRLVTLHGGTVEAHSEGPGRGSEFIVRLPVSLQTPPPAVPDPAPPPGPPERTRDTPRRILIVDDNTDSARSLAMLQSRRGHVTRTAFTGPEAVTAAAEFLPEVALLDIGLPGMDGFEVARRLRAMPELAGVLLVAISGYDSKEDRARAREAGFDEYQVKPANLTLLRQWMRERAGRSDKRTL